MPCASCSAPTPRSASSPRCSCSCRRLCWPTSPPARSAAPRSQASPCRSSSWSSQRRRGPRPHGASRSPAGALRRRCSRSCVSSSSSGGSATGRPRSTTLGAPRSRRSRSAAIDALETTFARYLPQLVLAAVVPVAVLVFVASIDPVSAGVMLLTLPLVPVFMWLVGRYTERRTRARWRALAQLATHFTDVVRGLPTLRAFNRAGVQAERIAQVSDEYRRTTMGTLRVAFLSGTVLELAATLGIALVAVTVGVRLVGGGLGFEAGLTVLVLAPELYLPLRNLAAQYHASADGLAVAERLLDLLEEPPTAGSDVRPCRAAEPARGPGPSRGSLLRLSDARGRRARLDRPRARSRRDGCARRPERERQEHDRLAPPPPRGARRGQRPGRSSRPRGVRRGRLAGAGRLGAAAADAVPRHGRREHPARRRRGLGKRRPSGGRAGRRRHIRPRAAGRRTKPSSARADARSRPASCSGSRWHEHSFATPRS